MSQVASEYAAGGGQLTRSFDFRDSCPVCDSKKGDEVYSCGFGEAPISDYLDWFYSSQGAKIDAEKLNDGSYRLIRCDDCKLIYQQEILNDPMMEVLYDRWLAADIDNQYNAYQSTARTMRYITEIKRIIDYFKRAPSSIKVMDFGMGWSEWIRIAASFGCQAYGAELSAAKIEHARRFGIEVLSWDEMPEHEFCLVNTEQVFEHIPHPYETLVHLKKCLKPDGLIKISVPDGAGIEAKLKKSGWQHYQRDSQSLNAAAPLEHINCFTHESLLVLAERTGMKAVSMPLPTQLSGFVDIKQPAASVKSMLKPVYQRVRPSTYVFLTPA